MAYDPNQLFGTYSGLPALKRVIAKTIQPKTFAAGTGTLAKLTPVVYNTSTNQWTVWANGGANGTGTIKGFVWPDPITLVSDKEVIGNVLIEGKIHFDDIALPTGQTAANLKTACRSGPRDLGLFIQGLDQVR